jgi:hypothetical protein
MTNRPYRLDVTGLAAKPADTDLPTVPGLAGPALIGARP